VLEHLVGHDARDEIVTLTFCMFKDVQVPDVKQVEGSTGIANTF
jgi:hypothetical protein